MTTFAASMEKKTFYSEKVSGLSVEIRRLRKRNTTFVVSELTTFGLMIAALVGFASTDTGYAFLYLAVLMSIAYMVIRRCDVRNSHRIEMLENTRSVYQKELAYLDGDFSGFGDGAQYVNPSHPYTYDMDVFGRDSLFNRINRTITTGGSDVLAAMLGGEGEHTLGPALKELAEAEPLRTQFLSYGQQAIINTAEVLAALQSMKEVTLPKWPKSPFSLIIACAAIAGLIISIILAAMGVIAADVPITWGLMQFCIVTGIIATHDLELSKMTDEYPNRFHNYCFEIELSDRVTYTYKITPGVARNQNATFLLKNIVLKKRP